MLERLSITFVMALFGWVMLSLMKRRQVALANRASRRAHGKTKTPSIVYFWSDGCSVCKRTQRPILDRIVAECGNERLVLTAYSVDQTPDVAEKWGVRTLPTTFVLDSAGTIRHANNGLAVAELLRSQLRGAGCVEDRGVP
jgi:thioredoxin-like negative regulator of GroEL